VVIVLSAWILRSLFQALLAYEDHQTERTGILEPTLSVWRPHGDYARHPKL
jgi:hypothetical protein